MRKIRLTFDGKKVRLSYTSSVEFESSLESNSLLGGRCFGVRRLSSVQRGDVSLMMFGVVESHDLGRDVGLEGIVCVRKGRKSVRHAEISEMVVGEGKMLRNTSYLPLILSIDM